MGKALRLFLLVWVLISFALVASSSIVVLNGLTHENRVQPGESYRGSIQIQNVGASGKGVKVYLTDYSYTFSGQSRHDEAGTMVRSNAEWITFTPELTTLDSAEVTTIEFEVTIPNVDSLRGSYWSVLMVEGVTEPDTTEMGTGIRINTAIRYAIQIISNVGNNSKSDLQFLGMELGQQDSLYVLNVAVQNSGELLMRPEMSLELFDANGEQAAKFNADKRMTLPGTSIMSTFVLEGLKPGEYNGVVVADCGEDRLYGTNLSVQIE